MIVLLTDFSVHDPYIGQVKAAIYRTAADAKVIDLFSNLPPFNVEAAAYLLPAYAAGFPPATVFLCVVDPGVGSARQPLMAKLDDCWFVGPDNGLFGILARRSRHAEWYRVRWRPQSLSNSFHGRDLFAPVAAMLASGRMPACEPCPAPTEMTRDWPDDLSKVVYIDHYGNVITGLRAVNIAVRTRFSYNGRLLSHARVFSDVERGESFWYCNANGLVEFAVNQGSAAAVLNAAVGESFATA